MFLKPQKSARDLEKCESPAFLRHDLNRSNIHMFRFRDLVNSIFLYKIYFTEQRAHINRYAKSVWEREGKR